MSTHTQDVKHVKWHPCRELLASCGYDDTVRLFKEESDDWESCNTLKGHGSTVWSLDFNQTGSRLATCSADCTVKIWQEYEPGNAEGVSTTDNIAAWKCVCTVGGFHERPIYSVSWSSDDVLASAGGDDSICVYREVLDGGDSKNCPKFELAARVRGAHAEDVNCIEWNPSQKDFLASAGDDGQIKLWTLDSSL